MWTFIIYVSKCDCLLSVYLNSKRDYLLSIYLIVTACYLPV